jgi:antitoxin component YwqK of YwqJK toxin-antitoxin module
MSARPALSLLIAAAPLGLLAGCTHTERPGPSAHPAENIERVEEYWPDGGLRLRKEVLRDADGVLVDHGTYTRWYTDGSKEYQATFVHGKKHGVATRWHRNGRVWIEEHYQHGLRHGISTTWDEKGVKRKEESHVDGKPHGTWTVWDGKGRIKTQRVRQAGPSEP